MSLKRGIKAFLYTILIVLIISLFSINWVNITGFVASLANVALEIQTSLRAPENLTIFVNNQGTGDTTLNWSDSNAQGYYIWFSDNITQILQLNYSNANISELSNVSSPNITLVGRYNTTWNDTSAGTVQRRFYAVAAYTSNGDIFTTADVKLAKWNLTLYGEDYIGHAYFSTPLEQNITPTMITPPNDFCVGYTIVDDRYTYSIGGIWYGDLTNLEFGKGYLFDQLSVAANITSAGPIPTGNVTKYISGGLNYTSLGWESISTNGSISGLIAPSEDFPVVYGVDYTKTNEWTYSYYFGGNWYGDITQMEPGKAYLFGNFNLATNFTYERNPY